MVYKIRARSGGVLHGARPGWLTMQGCVNAKQIIAIVVTKTYSL
jgi:hypothetical protein